MIFKKLTAVAAIAGACSMSNNLSANETDKLKEILKQQQAQIEALSQKIETQQSVHNEALTHYIKNEVDKALKDNSGSLLTLGSNVENLTFKGDLRLRYENREKSDNSSKDRFRTRFRIGMLWKTNEGWEIGAGLASGGSGGNSTNDTWSESGTGKGGSFETGDLRLDYAYAKHKIANNVSITLGQHKNPFVSSKYLWDGDLRPAGISVQYANESGLFATIGGYQVEDGDGDNHAQMYAAQAGIETGGFTAALAYYHFNSETSDDEYGDDSSADIQTVSAYAEYAGKTDSFKYKIYGEYSVNIGADDESQLGHGDQGDANDTAWVLGAELGIDKLKFKYAFVHMESDAFYTDFTDSDFGSPLGIHGETGNAEGHSFGIGYKVSKNFEIAATYIMPEAIEGDSSDNSGDLLQLDFKYKF